MQFSYEPLYVAIKLRLYLHPLKRGGYHFESLDSTPRFIRIVVRLLLYHHNINLARNCLYLKEFSRLDNYVLNITIKSP